MTRVSELIDPITGTWDEELIRSIFIPVDVRRIMQIPINLQAFEGFIAWHPEPKGTIHSLVSVSCSVDTKIQGPCKHYGAARRVPNPGYMEFSMEITNPT